MEARTNTDDSSVSNNDAERESVIQQAARFGIELDDIVAYELTAKEREHYLTNQKIQTNRQDILSYDEAGRRAVFAEKEGEFTTPVLIAILLELQNKLNDKLQELAKSDPEKVKDFDETKAIINITLAMFARSDKVFQAKAQREYLGQLKKRGKEKSIRMFQHLESLAALSEKIIVIPDMVELLREFAIWEFGMYWNDAAKLLKKNQLKLNTLEPELIPLSKPDEDGKTNVFPFVDNVKDYFICYKMFGFRMLDVTYRHFEVSKIVNKKCDACEEQHGLESEATNAVGLSPEEVNRYTDFIYDFTESSTPGVSLVTLAANVKYFTHRGAEARSHLLAMLKNPLGVALSTKANANDDQRFDDFLEKLKIFKLSDEMKVVVGGAQQSAIAVLEKYENSKYTRVQSLLYLSSYFSPVRLDNDNIWQCQDSLEKLKKEKLTYEALIKMIIDLRASSSKNDSTKLGPALTNFLKTQIDIIAGSVALSGDGIAIAHVTLMQSEKPDICYFSFEVPTERVDTVKKILDIFHAQIANPIGMKLAACKLQKEDELINYFKELLEEHRLSPIQEIEYADFYAQAQGVLTQYIDPVNLGYLNPHHYFERGTLPFASLFERTHATEVDKAMMKLRNTKLPVTDRLLELIKLYEYAKKQESQKLRAGLQLFLLKYITWLTPAVLRPNAPAEEQRQDDVRTSFQMK